MSRVGSAYLASKDKLDWCDSLLAVWRMGARNRVFEEQDLELRERIYDDLDRAEDEEEFDVAWSFKTAWYAGWEAADALITAEEENGEEA